MTFDGVTARNECRMQCAVHAVHDAAKDLYMHTYINTYTGLTFKDPDGLTTSRGPLRYIRACCVELLLNCNGRSFTWQVQWSFYKGDFLGGYVHSRTHEGMRGHGFAPAHQGLLLVGHPKTSPRILSESLLSSSIANTPK